MSFVGGTLNTVWHWTFGGLPGALTRPGLLWNWSRPLKVTTDPAHVEGLKRGALYDVMLTSNLYLKKSLRFPTAARKGLKRAVALHVRQTMPSNGSDLLWAYEISSKTRGHIEVDVYFVKQRLVSDLKRQLAEARSQLRTLTLEEAGLGFHLIDERNRLDRPTKLWNWVSILVATSLICLSVFKEVQETRELKRILEGLEEQNGDLQQEAIRLRDLQAEQNTAFETVLDDLNHFRLHHDRLGFFLELTEAFDDDTWVSELSIERNSIRMSVFSGTDVSDVLERLDNVSYVSDVGIEGPVTFDSFSRKNRFELLATLKTRDLTMP